MISQTVIRQSKPEVGQINLHRDHLVAAENLVGWLRMAEGGGGSVQDDSGNGNDGTFAGSGSWWGSGQYGKAAEFNNNDDYIEVPQVGAMPGGTISLWVNHGSAASTRSLFNHSDYQGSARLYLQLNTSDAVLVRLGTSSATTRGTITPNVWTHLGVTWGNGSAYVYINGIQQGAVYSYSGTPGSAGQHSTWGIFYNSSDGFLWPLDGSIDDARIYNRALTQNEIQRIKDDGDRKITLPFAVNVAAVGGISMPVVMQQMDPFNGGAFL